MKYKNSPFKNFAKLMLVLFMTNTVAPTLQFAFADSTQYYVDATSGNDANDGLTPATAWQTIAQVNGTTLLQGDTVSLLCGETWNETLSINGTNGGVGLPITVNGYGPTCGTSKPKIDALSIIGSSQITIDSIETSTPLVGNSVHVDTSNIITLSNNTLSNGSGVCMNIANSTALSVNGNTFSGCEYAVNVNESEAIINGNTFSAITQDALTVMSTLPVNITQNTFSYIDQNTIIYGQDTDVTQNSIEYSCNSSSL